MFLKLKIICVIKRFLKNFTFNKKKLYQILSYLPHSYLIFIDLIREKYIYFVLYYYNHTK
jgi:hypothetical protein